MHEAREPLRKLLYSKGYTCLRSVLRYVLVEAPDTIATLDHKSLSNCLQITNPITQDDDPADMLSDVRLHSDFFFSSYSLQACSRAVVA